MRMLWPVWWFWGRDMPWFFDLPMQGNLAKGGVTRGTIYQRRVFPQNLEGVWLHKRGWPNFQRDFIVEKGRLGMDFFWSLEFPNGTRCTLGVCLGKMSREFFTKRKSGTRLYHWTLDGTLTLAVDFGLPVKEVNPRITLRAEVQASRLHYCWYKHHIVLFTGWENVHMYICVYYCK